MKALKMLKRFVCEEDGLETVEYAIIAALITVGAIATIASVGFWVNARFEDLEVALQTTPSGG